MRTIKKTRSWLSAAAFFVVIFLLFGSNVALPESGILPSLAEPVDARPKLGARNTNPLDSRANRQYGNVTDKIRALFSELTLLPPDSFDVVWYPEENPNTMAAMTSEARMEVATDKNAPKAKARPVLYVSEQLLHEVASDDQLEGVLLHEFGHQLEDAKFKEWVTAQQKEYVRRQQTIDPEKGKNLLGLMDKMGRDLQEHAADITAQYYLMLRRRSPLALLQLFEKWHKESKGKNRWEQKGIAGYFSRSHPDPAERIRALVAFNGAMEGNKEVYPADLRNKPQTTEFLEGLKSDTNSSEYLNDVMADLRDRIERYHRKRLQGVEEITGGGEWKIDKTTLEKEPYEIPHLPFNSKVRAESERILSEGLDNSDRQYLSYIAGKLEEALAKPLSLNARAELQKRVRYTLERFLDAPYDFAEGTAEQKETIKLRNKERHAAHQAKIKAMPGYQAMARSLRNNERRLILEVTQLFHDEHPTYYTNRDKSHWPVANSIRSFLGDLPKKSASTWLKSLPDKIRRSTPEVEAKETLIALNILNPGERSESEIQNRLTQDEYLDLMERLLHLNPSFAVQNLGALERMTQKQNPHDGGWEAPTAAQKARRVAIISTAIENAAMPQI